MRKRRDLPPFAIDFYAITGQIGFSPLVSMLQKEGVNTGAHPSFLKNTHVDGRSAGMTKAVSYDL
jgi:hypothetical protein